MVMNRGLGGDGGGGDSLARAHKRKWPIACVVLHRERFCAVATGLITKFIASILMHDHASAT